MYIYDVSSQTYTIAKEYTKGWLSQTLSVIKVNAAPAEYGADS